MATTPYSSDLSDSDRDDAGPSTRRHLQVSSSKADPEVLAPIVDPLLASRRVNYYHSPLIGSFSYGYGHPMKPQRMRMAHSLISAYGLDQCMTLREPKEADKVDMTRFHTDEYIDFLERVNPDNGMALTGAGTRFLVGEDCPPFQSVFQFCSLSSGGSISAANAINSGSADIAINWAGGLHHAKKREASGFCYTNDIVLGILELLRVHSRVLYIDIDIHHGDGVEEAFYSTNRVLTLSIHKFGDFFPGTGDVKDVGIGPGKGYAVNVPLRDGVGDREYQSLLFQPVVQHIMEWYRPGAVVLQCGADSLAGDKLGCFNLSMRGHAACVSYLQSFNVPLLMVGGGGYTVRNVARTWTYETALLLGREPDEDLPFNEYMNWFGPEYKLDVRPTSMENLNSDAYLEGLRSRIIDTLRGLPFAPSVQMQPTPKYALNAHAEGQLSDSEEEGELEKRISKLLEPAYSNSLIRRYPTPSLPLTRKRKDKGRRTALATLLPRVRRPRDATAQTGP
ncbi:histone deacetylase [Microstroma glucosiphilum]|uniref:histone deacetylase n=1 Tax=Pseudomicrostroma glucosiphilum TaxID=1684307 RepID=A0A316U6B2_9BASI|nr:histone deacetylase [Pseudomicrostroma glucosiphilum]PWN18495.1 histone deacetylase [Pseudomicrostroma glucosiphilum]